MTRHLRLFCALVLPLALCYPRLAAALPGDLDPSFNPAVNGGISAMAIQPDGKIVIGGAFTEVAGISRPKLARLNADGTLDAAFAPRVEGYVNCLAIQNDGKVVLGGRFTAINETARQNIARINADGSLDFSFNPGADNTLNCMAVQPDGQLLVGGEFSRIGGRFVNRVARLSHAGVVDVNFNLHISNGVVGTIGLQSAGKMVIGGIFWEVEGVSRKQFAHLNSDGSLDTAFPDVQANASVSCTVVQPDGKILLCGAFTRLFGKERDLGRLNTDGSLAVDFVPTITGDGIVNVSLQTDGKILIAGYLSEVNGVPRPGLARLFADGTVDQSFSPGGGPNSFATGTAVQADGKILLLRGMRSDAGPAQISLVRILSDSAPEEISASPSRLQWLRGGASAETQSVIFELSTDEGASWISLGVGTRIDGGWELADLRLPESGQVRARARVLSGRGNNSSGILEAKVRFSFETTEAPTLRFPIAGSLTSSPATLAYTLVEEALPGSVKVTYSGRVTRVLTLAASQETAGEHSFVFNPTDPTASQEIASGEPLPDGDYTVSLSYQDAAGNPAAATASVFVEVARQFPYSLITAMQGGQVPGEPAGTTFSRIGHVSVDRGQLGALVKIQPPDGRAVQAVVGGPAGTVLVRAGDPAGPGLVFERFREPVFGGGAFGFMAKLVGAATSANDTSMWSSASGALTMLAREGDPAPDVSTPDRSAINFVGFGPIASPSFYSPESDPLEHPSYVMPADGSGMIFDARIRLRDDMETLPKTGLWQERHGQLSRMYGYYLRGTMFRPSSGLPGQRRAYASNGNLAVLQPNEGRTIFTYSGEVDGQPVLIGQNAPALGKWGVLGRPAVNQSLQLAFWGKVTVGAEGTSDTVIAVGRDQPSMRFAAQEGSAPPGIPEARYATFGDPAINDAGVVAFLATIRGPGINAGNNSVLFSGQVDGVVPVARTGTAAAELGNSAITYRKITAFALPDSDTGPVFLATLAGPRVKATNNRGLWAVDSTGATRLLARTGSPLPGHSDGKIVSIITTLGAVLDGPGQGRSVDEAHHVAARITFTDHTTAAVRFTVP